MPLGLGKPNVLFNALYARIVADPEKQLTIYTALSLARPRTTNELEKRFIGPFMDRHLGADYPDLAYVAAQQENRLPRNVCVHEFYLQSGAMLGVGQAQRDYTSMNYTHVARDVVESDINLILQLIAVREENGQRVYSLACNPDVTGELFDRLAAAGKPRPTVVGVVHPDLPFVGNEAIVAADFFDIVLEDPASRHTLFALLRDPVSIGGIRARTCTQARWCAMAARCRSASAHCPMRWCNRCSCGIAQRRLRRRAARLERGRTTDREDRRRHGRSSAVSTARAKWSWMASCTSPSAGILKRRVYDDPAIESALADGDIDDVLPSRRGTPSARERRIARHRRRPRTDAAQTLRSGSIRFGTPRRCVCICPMEHKFRSICATTPPSREWNRSVERAHRCATVAICAAPSSLGSNDFYAWLRDLERRRVRRTVDDARLRHQPDLRRPRSARFACSVATRASSTPA